MLCIATGLSINRPSGIVSGTIAGVAGIGDHPEVVPLTDSTAFETVAQVVGKAFPRARPETHRQLVARADIRVHKAGQTIVAQGNDKWTVLVLDGHVGSRRTSPDGREVIPKVVPPGQLSSLMPIASRPAVVETVALTPCLVALWPGHELHGLASDDAGLAFDLLDHALLGFEAIVERLDGLLYQDAVRRVARVLEQHAEIMFGDMAVLSRAYLPALVGTSREMTGRVLRKLEADGVVARIGRDRLRLLDPDLLARTAAPPPRLN
jgi:CRP-like cAMP-binding protein